MEDQGGGAEARPGSAFIHSHWAKSDPDPNPQGWMDPDPDPDPSGWVDPDPVHTPHEKEPKGHQLSSRLSTLGPLPATPGCRMVPGHPHGRAGQPKAAPPEEVGGGGDGRVKF